MNERPTPETSEVAKAIGKLAAKYKVGDINAIEFTDLRAAQIRALEWAQQTMREHNMNLFKFKHKIDELKAGGELL